MCFKHGWFNAVMGILNCKGVGDMKTIALGRIFLSKTFILNCQIASLLAAVLLLSDISDASEVTPTNAKPVILIPLETENYLR
jgi:hypothetical protein